MNSNDAKILSAALSKWAVEEMQFKSVASVDDKKLEMTLLPLCKGSAMAGLWTEIIATAKAQKAASNIKGNIELETLKEKETELKREVEKEEQEAEMLEKEIASLELHLNKCKEDLQETNLKLLNAREQEKLANLKSCLLDKYSQFLNLKNEEYKSFKKWFDELCDVYLKHFSVDLTPASNFDNCLLDIGAIFIHLQDSFRKNMLESKQEKQGGVDKPWEALGQLLVNYRPDVIASSVQALTESSTSKLKEEEQKIDFVADLKKLEEKYSETNDGEETPLATVKNMLRQWDLDCVRIHTQCIISENNATKMAVQNQLIRGQIFQIYEQLYDGIPSTLQLAMDSLDAELQLASSQGHLRSLHSSFARLQQEIKSKTQTREKLVKLRERINSFSQTLENNQKQIVAVTTNNSRLKAKLLGRQKEVLDCAKTKVCGHKVQIMKICTDLRETIHARMSAFDRADIGKLQTLKLSDDKTLPFRNLTINRYKDISHQSGGMAYQKTMHVANIQSHILPSSFMHHIANYKKRLGEIESLSKKDAKEASVRICEHLKGLETKGIALEIQQIDVHGRKYEKSMDIVKSADLESDTLSELIKTWYDQPAQYQTPWQRVDCLSLKEWRKKIDFE